MCNGGKLSFHLQTVTSIFFQVTSIMVLGDSQISLLETEAYVSGLLDQETKLIQQMGSKVMTVMCNNFICTSKRLSDDIKSFKTSSSEALIKLKKDLECSRQSITAKDVTLANLRQEIESLRSAIQKERLAHKDTKDALAACQTELQSTGADLERYFQVSENDRKKIHSAYLEMREKAVQESLKCNKYETEFCMLKNDKENCETKLKNNQKELLRLSRQLKTSKSGFEKSMVNKEAQRQQMQYIAHIKSQSS